MAGPLACICDPVKRRIPAAKVKNLRGFVDICVSVRSRSCLDGRDIGTAVLPDADYKFFVDADVDIRAHRRWKELINRGSEAMLPAIMEDLVKRDERDRSRQHAPLKPADNAILVDTTEKSVEEMVRFALKAIGRQPLPGKS